MVQEENGRMTMRVGERRPFLGLKSKGAGSGVLFTNRDTKNRRGVQTRRGRVQSYFTGGEKTKGTQWGGQGTGLYWQNDKALKGGKHTWGKKIRMAM